MPILICIPCLLTGGTEIQTLNLVSSLVSGGHHVVVGCYFEYAEEMVNRYRAAGAEVELMQPEGKRIGGWRGLWFLYKGLRCLVKKYRPEVAHVQYMAPGAQPCLFLKLLGVPHIAATAHTDARIYPSLHLRDHYMEHYHALNPDNTIAIPHVQLLPEFVTSSTPARAEKGLRMCHSGNMSSERNPETLFHAMRLAMDATGDDVYLDIMGVSNPLTQELVEKYQLENHVHCMGSYPYLRSLEMLPSYDVLVLLEAVLKKGIFFASKLADYAQANRPILAVSPVIGYASDIMRETGAGLAVDNEKPEEIASALETLLLAKRSNKLDSLFSVETLSRSYSPEIVADIYKNLVTR